MSVVYSVGSKNERAGRPGFPTCESTDFKGSKNASPNHNVDYRECRRSRKEYTNEERRLLQTLPALTFRWAVARADRMA